MAYWIIEERTGMSRFAVRTHKGTKNIPDLEIILEKLCSYVPIQYIFGHTEWMGLDLQVTPATLIPRPETAEMVERIADFRFQDFKFQDLEFQDLGFQDFKIQDSGFSKRVLDVGTGSGCIALGIKKRHPEWRVEGLDKSPEAVAVAEANAKRSGLDVRFYEADILRDEIGEYDMIVSNPPYIRPSERNTMTENTLRHEPEQALFVPEDDPLLFYRRIAEIQKAPELWFEISETQGEAVLALMQQTGYEAQCINDIYGKQRFIHATKCR